MHERYADRAEAGRILADALAPPTAPPLRDPVVLALPRGGVPVGLEVARRLHAPLDLILVRKIGALLQPELAVAAVVDGDPPDLVVNDDILRHMRMSAEELEAARVRELAEIERRRAAYLGDRAPVPVAGRDVVVVDDGIATGATARAALKALRRRGPRSITLAIPVAAPDTLAALAREVDRVVCPWRPDPLMGIGAHYRDFHQLTDEEVAELLAEADRLAESSGPG